MWRSLAIITVLGCGSSPKSPTTPSAESTRSEQEVPGPANALALGTPATGEVGRPAPVGLDHRCDSLAVADLSIDGLGDDWKETRTVARVGMPEDGAVAMRCTWDGTSLAFFLDIKDDRLIRVKGGAEDRVTLSVSAGGKPLAIAVWPGNQLAKAKITRPRKVEVADSLQPNGFSVEIAIPASAIAGYSPSTPAFDLALVFHDSDAATGGDTTPLEIKQPIELPDRKDLLDDFLAAVRLKKTDIKLDTLADIDPDRKGKERLVAGGTVIGVLTKQFAYVSLPAASAADVKKVELLPLGAKHQVVSALVRQTGNGGSRDLLMLWTVWSGQLQPLVNIEVRKDLAGNVLEATYRIEKGKKGPELHVEAAPAVGFSRDAWHEEPAGDADSIVLPWDGNKAGIAYALEGAEIVRRDLPKRKPKR